MRQMGGTGGSPAQVREANGPFTEDGANPEGQPDDARVAFAVTEDSARIDISEKSGCAPAQTIDAGGVGGSALDAEARR